MKRIFNFLLTCFLGLTVFTLTACGDDDVVDTSSPLEEVIKLSFNNGPEETFPLGDLFSASYKINTMDTTIDLSAYLKGNLKRIGVKAPLRIGAYTQETVSVSLVYEVIGSTSVETWGYNRMRDSVLVTLRTVTPIGQGIGGKYKVSGTFKGTLHNAQDVASNISGTFMNVLLRDGDEFK